MWIVSVISLFIVMVCCTLGVFAPKRIYADNLLQRLGMTGIVFFCLPRFLQLLQMQTLTSVCMPAEAQVMGHVGMALYCIGTTTKVLLHHYRRGLWSMST